ncbi:hypothetical protein BLL52_1232 [Rhodoferax antarcticus ANT.BR]|uniref:Uncharacterized protein n=1 Tax=Rhodoferax antarcticus ANT.BR TaxID=1111071 RepID=A0A1Q8YHC8_9BURK|nr:hypothetical protein BLL52_1232 [Rhodoferax antarcticus ANT.BR]
MLRAQKARQGVLRVGQMPVVMWLVMRLMMQQVCHPLGEVCPAERK